MDVTVNYNSGMSYRVVTSSKITVHLGGGRIRVRDASPLPAAALTLSEEEAITLGHDLLKHAALLGIG